MSGRRSLFRSPMMMILSKGDIGEFSVISDLSQYIPFLMFIYWSSWWFVYDAKGYLLAVVCDIQPDAF